MKYLWIFVILCAGSAFGQNYYGPDYLNLHCTKPDLNSNAVFGVPPQPGLAPNTSVNGNMVVYCDAVSGTLKTSVSGGAYASIGSGQVINATNFGVVSDNSVLDATVTNTSNIITCPNSDCHFLTTAAVGQVIQGGTAANGIVLPTTTILSVDSDTQVHTVANATATPTAGTVYLAWGPDNTAALKAAWAASVQICHYLQLPAGVFFTKEALNSQNAGCANQNAGAVGGIIGAGGVWINSKFLMRYDFLYASGGTSGSGCNGGTVGIVCFMGILAADVVGLAIDGMYGNNNPAASVYVIENNAGYFDRVGISSLCMGCSHVLGKHFAGTEPIDFRGATVDVGTINCQNDGTGLQINLSPCLAPHAGTGTTIYGFWNGSGSAFSKDSFYSGTNGGDGVHVAAGEFHEENDYFTNNVSPITNAGGLHYLKHCFFNNNTINISSGATLYIEDNDFTGESTAHLVVAAGAAVFDQGANIYPNSTFVTNSGTYYGPLLPPGKNAVAAGNLVLSAGWGTTAAWSALNGNTSFSGTITASGTGQAANPTVTFTFPTAFPVAPRTCYALQVGGTQAQGTFAVSSVTNTGVVFTYSGTPGAGNTVFVQSLCQN